MSCQTSVLNRRSKLAASFEFATNVAWNLMVMCPSPEKLPLDSDGTTSLSRIAGEWCSHGDIMILSSSSREPSGPNLHQDYKGK